MSYDLAVWEGLRPESDEVALAHYEEQIALADARYEAGQPPTAPTPRVAEFLRTVIAHFPADEGDVDGTWSMPPSERDADGSFAYLTLTYPGAQRSYAAVVELAVTGGLIAFDPQTRAVVPGTPAP